MKKKGSRSIPDFSSKRKGPPVPGAPARQADHVPTRQDRVVKPQSKSTKSGHRG